MSFPLCSLFLTLHWTRQTFSATPKNLWRCCTLADLKRSFFRFPDAARLFSESWKRPARRARLFFTCITTANPLTPPHGRERSLTSPHCVTRHLIPAARSFRFLRRANTTRMIGGCTRVRRETTNLPSWHCSQRLTHCARAKFPWA